MTRWIAVLAALLSTAAVVLPAAAAASGPSAVPRSTWVPDGWVDAVEVIGDTAFLAGSFSRVGPYTGGSAVVDRTTGDPLPGWPQVAGTVNAVEPDGAGGWFLGGRFDAVEGIARSNLAHVLADGSVDPAFAPATDAEVVTMLRSGSVLYIGGSFGTVNGQPRTSLAGVWVADGALTSFAPVLTGLEQPRVRALATRRLGGSTTLFIGGAFVTVNGVSRVGLAAFTDGALSSYAPSLNGRVEDLELDGFSGLYVVGNFTTANGLPRGGGAYLTGTNGQTTGEWAPGANGTGSGSGPAIYDLYRSGSTIYLAGDFTTMGGKERLNLAAVSAASGAPTDWTPGTGVPRPNRYLHEVALSPDGTAVYAAGPGEGVRAYDGATGQRADWAPVGDAQIDVIVPRATDVLIGGRMQVAGGVLRDGFAALDLPSGRPTALDVAVDGRVEDMAHNGATLYVAGDFSNVAGPGGGIRTDVASLDTARDRWSSFSPPYDDFGRAIAVSDDEVYVLYRQRMRAFVDDPPGSSAQVITTGDINVKGSSEFKAFALGPATIYVGGDFSDVHESLASVPVPRNNLMAVDRRTFALRPWNANADAEVNMLAFDGATVFTGGAFEQVAGASRPRVAGLDPATGTPTALTAALGSDVLSLARLDGTLLVGRTDSTTLAQLNASTGAQTDWNPTMTATGSGGAWAGPVNELVISRDRGVLVAGGPVVGLGPVRTANLAIFPLSPPAPVAVVATPGDGQASVGFATTGDGGSPVTEFTVTAFPGGATATGGEAPVTVGGLENGTVYTFSVRATNAVGTGPESAPSAPVTPVASPPDPAVAPPPDPAVGPPTEASDPDRVAPVLETFTVRPRRFRRRVGTQITVRLSELSTVRFVLLEPVRGRKVAGRCRKLTAANRRRPACRRLVRRASVERAMTTTPPPLRFRPARVRPGRYVLRATPMDAAGNVGRARRVVVKIRR